MSRFATLVAIVCFTAASAAQQSSPLRFEVVSIKPGPENFDAFASIPRQAAGRLFLLISLRPLIQRAYGLQNLQVLGGPSSLMARRFQITAKAENPDATPAQFNEMLRTLLAERFHLKFHMETRTLDVAVLKLARPDGKLGPNLKPSMLSCLTGDELLRLAEQALGKGDVTLSGVLPAKDDPCGDRSPLEVTHVKGQPIATLLPLLSTRERPFVEDRTGLSGRYDWDLTFDSRPLSVNANSPSPNDPPLLVAIEQQLGLKVEAGKGQVEFLVIDSVEDPTPD